MKRALGAFMKAKGPQRYGVHGKPFVCQLCGHDRFMPQFLAGFIGCCALVCTECGHVELFALHSPPILDEKAS